MRSNCYCSEPPTSFQTKRTIPVQGVAVAAQIGRYVLFAGLLAVASWFIPADFELWYYAAHIVLAVLFFVFIIFVFQAGKVQHEGSESYGAQRAVHQQRSIDFTALQQQFDRAVAPLHQVDPTTKSLARKAIVSLVERASMTTPSTYEQHHEFAQQVTELFEALKQEVSALSGATGQELQNQLLKHLTTTAQAADQTIKAAKQTIR